MCTYAAFPPTLLARLLSACSLLFLYGAHAHHSGCWLVRFPCPRRTDALPDSRPVVHWFGNLFEKQMVATSPAAFYVAR